jgi:hypothetical protein
MDHQKTKNSARFEKKLSLINSHLILIKPFPKITLSKMDTLLRRDDRETPILQTLSVSFPCRRESTKKIINSGNLKIPTQLWLHDP